MLEPAWTGSGESVFVTLRSAEGLTVVCALAWLLAGFVSFVDVDAVAAFVTDGAADAPAVATIVTVTSLRVPALTVPMLQLRLVVPEQLPLVELADTSERPEGNVSARVT